MLNGIADALDGPPRSAGQSRATGRSGSRLQLRRGNRAQVQAEKAGGVERAGRRHPCDRLDRGAAAAVVAIVQGPQRVWAPRWRWPATWSSLPTRATSCWAFTKIGLMPDGAASALVAAAVGRIRAMRMALLDRQDSR